MRRRQFIRLLVAGVCASAFVNGHAHTPYNQWRVYRRKHLLIGCHKEDPRTYELAKQTVAILASRLPAAKARIARARSPGRLASLLGTEQLDVAIVGNQDATGMAAGSGDFAPYGEIPLRALFLLTEHILIGRAAIPDRHAWLIASALQGSDIGSARLAESEMPIPWHNGATLFRKGIAIPAENATQVIGSPGS